MSAWKTKTNNKVIGHRDLIVDIAESIIVECRYKYITQAKQCCRSYTSSTVGNLFCYLSKNQSVLLCVCLIGVQKNPFYHWFNNNVLGRVQYYFQTTGHRTIIFMGQHVIKIQGQVNHKVHKYNFMDPVSGALTQNMDMMRGVSKWGTNYVVGCSKFPWFLLAAEFVRQSKLIPKTILISNKFYRIFQNFCVRRDTIIP